MELTKSKDVNLGSFRSFMKLLKALNWPTKITVLAVFLSVVEAVAGLIIPIGQ